MDPHNLRSEEVGMKLMEKANKEIVLYQKGLHPLVPLSSCTTVLEINALTEGHCSKYATDKPWPIMLNFLSIMLLSNVQKFAYYMLNIMPMITAIMPQFVYDFIILND